MRTCLLRIATTIFFLTFFLPVHAQTLGGQAVYNFLHLPASPMLSASGGVNISYPGDDIGLAINNPALLTEQMHSQVAASFNSFFAGTKAYHLAGGYYLQKQDLSLGGSIFFIDYGSLPQTTTAGERDGTFRPRDAVLQFSAAKKYLQNWQYGLSAKWIYSSYSSYTSSAIAFDAGILFFDSSHSLSVGLVAKNMGVQLSAYGDEEEELPFDLQIGITKRLTKAPFGFSLTAQHLHRFDLIYRDTVYNNENNLASNASFFTKVFSHFVVATHVYIGPQLEAMVGYNRLRRMELNLGSAGNGLNGFSAGFKAKFKKLQFQYARAYFGSGRAYNQFGINTNLNKLIGISDL